MFYISKSTYRCQSIQLPGKAPTLLFVSWVGMRTQPHSFWGHSVFTSFYQMLQYFRFYWDKEHLIYFCFSPEVTIKIYHSFLIFTLSNQCFIEYILVLLCLSKDFFFCMQIQVSKQVTQLRMASYGPTSTCFLPLAVLKLCFILDAGLTQLTVVPVVVLL